MKRLRRIVVMAVGGTVLAIGVALIVLPGPAFIVVPLGLAILAVEFAWARRLLRSARAVVSRRKITSGSVQRGVAFLLRRGPMWRPSFHQWCIFCGTRCHC